MNLKYLFCVSKRFYSSTIHNVMFLIPQVAKDYGIDHGQVGDIFVKPGDAVCLQSSVMEIETDKVLIKEDATMEGTIEEICVKRYDRVVEKQIIYRIRSK